MREREARGEYPNCLPELVGLLETERYVLVNREVVYAWRQA